MWEEAVTYSVSISLHRLRHSCGRALLWICCPVTGQSLPRCLGPKIPIMLPLYSRIFKVWMAASAAFYVCNVERTYVRFPPFSTIIGNGDGRLLWGRFGDS